MRYITLKTVATRKGPTLDYRKQIEVITCEPTEGPQGRTGFDTQTNRRAIRILDALESCELGNVLRLEDADYEFLKGRLEVFVWPWADRAFEDFSRSIETAPRDAPAPIDLPNENLDGLSVN